MFNHKVFVKARTAAARRALFNQSESLGVKMFPSLGKGARLAQPLSIGPSQKKLSNFICAAPHGHALLFLSSAANVPGDFIPKEGQSWMSLNFIAAGSGLSVKSAPAAWVRSIGQRTWGCSAQ